MGTRRVEDIVSWALAVAGDTRPPVRRAIYAAVSIVLRGYNNRTPA